jgi:hypothetical protein
MTSQEIIQALNIPAGYEKPTVDYPDGNAFAIFAAVNRAVRRVDSQLAVRYSQLAMKADSYNTVLAVATTLVNFGNEDEDEGDEYEDEEDEG